MYKILSLGEYGMYIKCKITNYCYSRALSGLLGRLIAFNTFHCTNNSNMQIFSESG